MLKNMSILAIGGVDTEESEHCEVCPLSVYRSPRFDTDDVVELFEILDTDGGGSVSVDEFCDEMVKLATTKLPIQEVRMLKQMSIIRQTAVEHLVERFDIEPFSDFSANEQTLEGPFSSVSTPNFARKYSLESS